MTTERETGTDQEARPGVYGVVHGLGWPESRSSERLERLGWPGDVVRIEETSEADDG